MERAKQQVVKRLVQLAVRRTGAPSSPSLPSRPALRGPAAAGLRRVFGASSLLGGGRGNGPLGDRAVSMAALKPSDSFQRRHNSPILEEQKVMAEVWGFASMDALIDATVPKSIRRPDLNLRKYAEELTESQMMAHMKAQLKVLASKIKVMKSYIGVGYYDTLVPTVSSCNLLENPGWFREYTPYQAEIAQGRLESLLNFQTMITDLTVYKEHIGPRWLSTLRAADLDHTETLKTPRQTLPDVQHGSLLNHQFEHEYETILSYPRGISTCSAEDLVFISDSLHDRIIITNGTGRVLDYIGSCAGFEDGSFESARLRRPSSIVYDIEQNCLYIADCENHAIRRAHLPSRMLDTVYPKHEEQQGLVRRWLRGLGFIKNSSPIKDSNRHQISYPWHLSVLPSGKIIAATQGFEKLWTFEIDTGAATVESDQEPAANLKKLMESKASELEDWTDVYETLASRGLACEGSFSTLVSQVAVLKSEVLVIDTGMHRVLRLDLGSGHLTNMQLSNLALLGIPGWWSLDDDPQAASSLERLHEDRSEEAITSFQVQPGRCLISVDVALLSGTVLAEPLTDVCIWRQGRGSLVELSTFDGELMMQKVTAAQRYVDELYDLEGTIDKQMEDSSQDMPVPSQSPSGLPFYSSIDVSLGTGEVVFDAVLYLKRDSSAACTDSLPDFFNRNDSHISRSMKVTVPSCQKSKDFPDGDILSKHLRFRVKCKVSADAPQTSMMLVHVQL